MMHLLTDKKVEYDRTKFESLAHEQNTKIIEGMNAQKSIQNKKNREWFAFKGLLIVLFSAYFDYIGALCRLYISFMFFSNRPGIGLGQSIGIVIGFLMLGKAYWGIKSNEK